MTRATTGPAIGRDGRVPFRLRIGVTGHRNLRDEAALAPLVKDTVDRIRALVPGPRLERPGTTPVVLTVVSPLAEGADRLVARAVLDQPDADLEAPLPLPVEDYMQDFATDASKREFEKLLGRSTIDAVVRDKNRPEAYEVVGRYVVDHCDVLIALWDGEPGHGRGGTAEIVAYARRRGVPLFVLDTTTAAIVEEPAEESLAEVRLEWRRVDGYSRARVQPNRFHRAVDNADNELMDAARAAAIAPSGARRIADWLAPYAARTDLLAEACRHMYLWLTAAVFLLAALAVVSVTVQVLFLPEMPELAVVELAMLLALLLIVVLGRWRKISRRFICDRFFAERLREAPFLVLAGLDRPRGSGFTRSYLGHRPEGWPWRAFAEVWNLRPRDEVAVTNAATLQTVVADVWIEGQIRYHQRSVTKNHQFHLLFLWGSVALLSATIAASALHAASVGGHGNDGLTWPNVIVLVSIAAPALGGAFTGIGAQREYARHAERSERMIDYLREAQRDVRAAEGLDAVRDAARQTEDLMLAENRDWFGALSFRDLEPHS